MIKRSSRNTQNVNVVEIEQLLSPVSLRKQFPIKEKVKSTVLNGREAVKKILSGKDSRLLVIAGPCSVHDPNAALDYAKQLMILRQSLASEMEIVMRVYFEKPRSTVGWKGYINDPDLDGTLKIAKGLKQARNLLLEINDLGMPAATEFLDPIVPQYIADLISWAAVGARTTESQTHREMASGLSMPVGFKNGTDGNVTTAVSAMVAARESHRFLGISKHGRVGIVTSRGNENGHIVLRGGSHGTNYHKADIEKTALELRSAGLPQAIMVDCSHANCQKLHKLQSVAWESLIQQKVEGSPALIGMMIESNLQPGKQDFPPPTAPMGLQYGVSITDPCLGFVETELLLLGGFEKLSKRKK